MAPDISIGTVSHGYIALVPEKPEGIIVFFQSSGKIDKEGELEKLAVHNDLGIAYISTNNKFEFLFDEDHKSFLAEQLLALIRRIGQPEVEIYFAGMSLAGTRALIMAHYIDKNEQFRSLRPKAIAVCDAPLDFIRFYKEGQKAMNLEAQDAAANEGYWTTHYIRKNIGCEPHECPDEYIAYSPITYSAIDTAKLESLMDVRLRCYTEPNVEWWMETRKKDYYGMNALDMALLVNELNKRGHQNAELILTSDKGHRRDGTYHPHSWVIVNENDLIQWFIDD